jgi:hypothetical protein
VVANWKSRLVDSDLSVSLAAVVEIRERIEIVHSTEYPAMLSNLLEPFSTLLTIRTRPLIPENVNLNVNASTNATLNSSNTVTSSPTAVINASNTNTTAATNKNTNIISSYQQNYLHGEIHERYKIHPVSVYILLFHLHYLWMIILHLPP